SIVLSFVISWQLFDRAWSFSPALPLLTIAAVTTLTVVTTQLAAYRTLRQKPAALLASEAA
ncbi:MAG TPA: hypothetical protein VFV50_08310, partial [Bdellovibrionales bacterium]|nr:hypothetical protein [Bdellovibrionales bacterium]